MPPLFGVPALEVLLILLVAIIYLGPILHILISRRSHGGAKFGWFLAELFLPFIAYIVFLIATQNAADSISPSNE